MIAAFIAMTLAASVFAGNMDTPEGLAEQFIIAVNARSAEKQRALIHPRSLADLSPIQKRFLDETLARDLLKTVPENRTVKVSKLEEPNLPFAGMVNWPVKPTHRLEIEFNTGEYSSTSIIRFIVKEKERWFIIVPMLNEENLKKYEERKKSQQENAPDKK